MSSSRKDSPEVVEFMSQFARLKDWCDDTPLGLAELAKSDSSIKDLCNKVRLAADFLKRNERRRRELFASPVDPAFLKAWRDFEERYVSVVSGVWLSDLLELLEGIDLGTLPNTPKADAQWTAADVEAKEQAVGIEEAIDFAQFNADQDDRWGASQEEFIQRILDGVAAWDRLKQDTGFDLRGVFRRRELIPFVLVPRHVAAKHGSAEKLTMLKNLQQAHDAFVYGATYGALALMRSILEAVLRDHYRAEGDKLSKRIHSISSRLPSGANEAALHRLRMLANAILHLDKEEDEGLGDMDEVQLEKEIVSLLFVLRALIEGVR